MSKIINSLLNRLRTKDTPEDIEAVQRAQQNLEFRASQMLARHSAQRAA